MNKVAELSDKTTVELKELPGDEALKVYDFIGNSLNPVKYMQACAIASIVKVNDEIVDPLSSQKSFDYVAKKLTYTETMMLMNEFLEANTVPTGEELKNSAAAP